ncbi:Hypothetical protein ADU71_0531 [Pediococcus damnosus]|uniref:hypothetical protein n=1 Tax=Pediococcus damnosus TaxID=51663 RepID=UPI00078C3F3E|nr:hypothetical protein [Pediococcus damnosus]AMV64450.1 Hypothetical protein ADU71_0531 [Pediococcus damnosus]
MPPGVVVVVVPPGVVVVVVPPGVFVVPPEVFVSLGVTAVTGSPAILSVLVLSFAP